MYWFLYTAPLAFEDAIGNNNNLISSPAFESYIRPNVAFLHFLF